MDFGITGRTALIVGGTGYLGRAVAAALLAEGAQVVLGGRDQERLDATKAELGGDNIGAVVRTVVIDTRDSASVDAALAQVIASTGRLDILVNTAAPSARTLDPARDRDADAVLDAIDGKAMGYLRVTQAALPHMTAAGFGRIVQISGQNAHFTASVTSAARNMVVTSFSKTLADAVAGSGVTINVVDPGAVTETPTTDVAMARGGDSTSAQVAALVTFLASVPAAAISGESIASGHRALGVQ
jgi:NAD(P)-dependent dehydrogenase (short-subunit alcohol dehydrogenase family)